MRVCTRYLLTIAVLNAMSVVSWASATVTINGQESYSASTQTWDAGVVTIQVDGYTKSAAYGQFSTNASVAAALAGLISNDCSSPVSAYANAQGVITLTPRSASAGLNVTVSSSSSFSLSSFSGTFSGPPPAPAIALSLTTGPVGMGILITGTNLGNAQDTVITVGGTVVLGTWTGNGIVIQIPTGLQSTNQSIVLTTGGQASNPAAFAVIAPFQCPDVSVGVTN